MFLVRRLDEQHPVAGVAEQHPGGHALAVEGPHVLVERQQLHVPSLSSPAALAPLA
ncbi:hypothetical protein [Amycolatopsis sp. GM8]|uniref:hypothetical protein n=1 Tax=Amycolatopsis sp. GM8 TaxID=2896530 RepID=UPI001F27C3E9|nr:hypothetical protein [Amycolatopsis sp. GM8]